MKRKLVITHQLKEELLDQIKAVIPTWEIIAGKERSIWEDHLNDAEIIAGWKDGIDSASLVDGSKLRWVQAWSAGVNSLPLPKLQQRNVYTTSANGVHAYPISETIFALMLGLTRKIHTYVRNQTEKTWHHSHMKLEIHNKTIGVIGVGAIGKETAKIAKAFGMHVLGVRHSGKTSEFVDEMFTPNELNSMLPRCDYVVVTLPLTKETEHLFTKKQFDLMKESSFFINIGRGNIIVEEDMIAALQNKQIAGAGLDVFATEPLPEENPLWEMDNVIVTPHTAGSTEHYDQRVIEDIFIPNLKEYLQEKPPTTNLVDYDKGY
ncbi:MULTISPECIES: D-2-hydroxyacid dehydrogenase [Bacillaceae]|uniref:D-2-hydroxyacid dehydrogenase n=1 Tax=Evansella alkalicola TaxID=745819 RepID=A0ABS6JZP3_9BACI|nr:MULTISPECIES: D-2-hydroxyacid dehydrogenase [Bacillaceae]MBU9722565.1 D-2-hydroxyacid dehydrogenase [Bacillus alkalicola]